MSQDRRRGDGDGAAAAVMMREQALAKRLWRESGEAGTAMVGGVNHPDMARALAKSGIPVNLFPDGHVPPELRWHPRAVIAVAEAGEIEPMLRGSIPADEVAPLMAQVQSDIERFAKAQEIRENIADPSTRHEYNGRLYRISGGYGNAPLRMEVQCPGIVARIRANVPASGDRKGNPLEGVVVLPLTEHGGLGAEVRWGRFDQGRTCRLSNRHHRGVLTLASELLDAILIYAVTKIATWWLPDAPGVGANPIPDDLLATKQVTRVLIAYPAWQRPEHKGGVIGWYKGLLEAHPALSVQYVMPAPDDFPTLVKPAPESYGIGLSVPVAESTTRVTWLDAMRGGSIEQVRRSFFAPLNLTYTQDIVIAPDAQSLQELHGGVVDWARRYLWVRFWQDGDRRWRLVRLQGKWWVHGDTGWQERSEEALRHDVLAWLVRHKVSDAKNPLVFDRVMPTRAMIEQFVFALEAECSSAALNVPAWLPDTVRIDGENAIPMWGLNADVLKSQKDPAVGRKAPEFFLSFENGTLDMDLLRKGQIHLTPLDPCYFGGPSVPHSLDVDMLGRLISAVDVDKSDMERWTKNQMTLIEALEQVAPNYVQSVLQQFSDYGTDHMLDRFACTRRVLGDVISWLRVWEKIMIFPGKKRGGRDLQQNAIQAANGADSIVIINDFDELADQYAFGPLVGKKIALMPDGHFDFEDKKAISKMKQLSGRGAVRVRTLYKDPIPNVRLATRLHIYVNEMPQLHDASGAMTGRMVVLPYTQTFFGREDDTRKDRVMQEGAGIALISLVGFYEAWNGTPKGLTHPKIAKELGIIERMNDTAAPVAGFVDKYCDVGSSYGPTTIEELHEAYKHAVNAGKIDIAHPVRMYRFADQIMHSFNPVPAGKDALGQRLYKGIQLNPAIAEVIEQSKAASKAARNGTGQTEYGATTSRMQQRQLQLSDKPDDRPLPDVDISDLPV